MGFCKKKGIHSRIKQNRYTENTSFTRVHLLRLYQMNVIDSKCKGSILTSPTGLRLHTWVEKCHYRYSQRCKWDTMSMETFSSCRKSIRPCIKRSKFPCLNDEGWNILFTQKRKSNSSLFILEVFVTFSFFTVNTMTKNAIIVLGCKKYII